MMMAGVGVGWRRAVGGGCVWHVGLTRVRVYLARAQVVVRFKDCIDDFKQILPLVEELANPALKQRHWEQIFKASRDAPYCIPLARRVAR